MCVALEIVYLPPESLKPYDRNTRKHAPADIEQIKQSIILDGFNDPIGIWGPENLIVEGHGRQIAAMDLGLASVPCIRLDHMTDDQRRDYAIRHNRTAELSEWDKINLNLELQDLEIIGFDMSDLRFDDLFDASQGTDYSVTEVPPPPTPEEPIAKPGDIWQLGEHRLMCADSTGAVAWAQLMDGEKGDMVFTDPPYGVDYASKNEYLNAISRGNCIQVPIQNDALANAKEEKERIWLPAFRCMYDVASDGCIYYITSPQGGELMMMMSAVHEAGWQLKHVLIWNKNNHVLGRSDYNYKHEPILYGWKKKHKFYGNGQFKTSVWDIPKPQKSNLHPTMKPVALVANAILDGTTEGMIVLDAFAGSGTTIIAAEQTGRKAYCMELDPRYVDVIIARWEQFTGKQAVLLKGGA